VSGICYKLTPVSSAGVVLTARTLTFMISDECLVSVSLSGGEHCKQCTTSEVYFSQPVSPAWIGKIDELILNMADKSYGRDMAL
jgi:hypothetical protein